MSIKLVEIIKGLLIKQEGTLNPAQIEVIPGGTAGTKTTIQSTQTADATITLPTTTSTLASEAYVDASSGTVNDLLDDHIADTTGAHAASAISTTASNVQTEIDNIASSLTSLDSRLDTLESAVISDPVTKSYVDLKDADLTSAVNSKLPLTGGTMTGDIEIGANKITSGADGIDFAGSAVRTYSELGGEITVDSNVVIDANTIQVIGNNFDSFVDLDLNTIAKVKNSIDPTSAQDLTTKNYVDTLLSKYSLSNWTRAQALTANTWVSLAYNGTSRYVAVSTDATVRIMYSSDGITWTNDLVSTNNALVYKDVCYGNGTFVAVAESGSTTQRVVTSTTGVTWTSRNTNQVSWQAVTYGNNRFVAVGAKSGIHTNNAMYSTDGGITWTAVLTSVEELGDVIYANGLFVAWGVTDTGAAAITTSEDGITWTPRSVSPIYSSSYFKIAYGNGLFVGVSASSEPEVITSTDGITWTSHISPTAFNYNYSLTFKDGFFVAHGSGYPGSVRLSQDGINWTGKVTPAFSSIYETINDGSKVVGVGQNGNIMYSLVF